MISAREVPSFSGSRSGCEKEIFVAISLRAIMIMLSQIFASLSPDLAREPLWALVVKMRKDCFHMRGERESSKTLAVTILPCFAERGVHAVYVWEAVNIFHMKARS